MQKSRKRCKQNHHLRDTCLFFLRRKVGLCIFLRFFANFVATNIYKIHFLKIYLRKTHNKITIYGIYDTVISSFEQTPLF